MPSLRNLWSEYKDKGLHILHIESQGHSASQVRAFCEKNGIEFPNVVGRNGFKEPVEIRRRQVQKTADYPG